MNTSIIVSSKSFRLYIDKISRAYLSSINDIDTVLLNIHNGEIFVDTNHLLTLAVEHRGEGLYEIELYSIRMLSKALKQVSEQPIKITFTYESSRMDLFCQF